MQKKDQVFLYIKDEIEKISSAEEKEILDEAKAIEQEAYNQLRGEAEIDAKHQLDKELDNLYGSDMKEIYNDALNIINSLSKTSRTVCKLFYIYNLTIPQIQMKTGMPEGTIKSALCRSRNQIKNKLKLC